MSLNIHEFCFCDISCICYHFGTPHHSNNLCDLNLANFELAKRGKLISNQNSFLLGCHPKSSHSSMSNIHCLHAVNARSLEVMLFPLIPQFISSENSIPVWFIHGMNRATENLPLKVLASWQSRNIGLEGTSSVPGCSITPLSWAGCMTSTKLKWSNIHNAGRYG